jgi:hypothetical protein
MQGARTRSVESPWACQVILLARTEGRRYASRPASFHAGCSHPERGISVGLPSDFFSSRRGRRGRRGRLLIVVRRSMPVVCVIFFVSRRYASRPASFHAGCSHPERGISVGLPSDFISSHRGTQRAQRQAVDCSAPINADQCETFEACLEPSFGGLPDIEALFGADFAADGHCRTNQH